MSSTIWRAAPGPGRQLHLGAGAEDGDPGGEAVQVELAGAATILEAALKEAGSEVLAGPLAGQAGAAAGGAALLIS